MRIEVKSVDDVLSPNKPHFSDEFLYLIYPSEPEIKETTEARRSASASYLYLLIDIDIDG